MDYSSIGRLDLEAQHKAMHDNLTTVQERCTQLIQENRDLKAALLMTEFGKYQEDAGRTSPKQPADIRLLMSIMGIGGEAGEIVDLHKKVLFHKHPFDKDKYIKEAGDVLWYLAELSSALGVSLALIAQRNIDKLKARYPEGFSTEKSLNRKEGDT